MSDTDAPKTMSVPEAGRKYLGIGRNASYEAANRGDIPYIQTGKLKRVPVIAMERKLERCGESTPPAQVPRREPPAATRAKAAKVRS